MDLTRSRRWPLAALALAGFALAAGVPAGASTFIRASLESLVASHETIVLGEVLEARSYWNSVHSFILTDVTVKVEEVLKGRLPGHELTFTLMGGTVGDLTSVIVGGAALERGNSYVLFVGRGNLPGAKGVLTVREHGQGVFDVVVAKDGLRAVSQANGHPLLPDAKGFSAAPGGAEGMPLSELTRSIRELAEAAPSARPTRQEVQ